jgi:ParB family transcriptional regulator, chromosome partitioning protein
LRKFRHYYGACNTSASSAAKSSNNVIGKKKFDSLLFLEDVTESASDNLDDENIESNVLDSSETSNNVIGKEDETQVNPDLKIVEEVFDGLGLMTWESFAF